MAVEIRRAVYSNERGTFIRVDPSTGQPVWSKDKGVKATDCAMTFYDRPVWESFVKASGFVAPADVVLAEVWPHGSPADPNGVPCATVEDIANAGLPRWGD